jgi:hypothetical protein
LPHLTLPPGGLSCRVAESFYLQTQWDLYRSFPHHLVVSFRATLEEVLEADLLLHVVDASHPLAAEQMAAVNKILDDLERGRTAHPHSL